MKRRAWTGSVALLAMLLLLAFFGQSFGPSSRARFPSSFAPEPEGLLAFRLLLAKLDVPVEVLRRPWDDLAPGSSGLLLVATPLQRGPDQEETRNLRGWLEAGGALLLIDDASQLERSPQLDRLLDRLQLAATAPLTDIDPHTLGLKRPDSIVAHGTPAMPAGSDLTELHLNSEAAFEESSRGIPLAITVDSDVVVAEIRVGRGRVVRVLGPLLANDRIGTGDNLTFALRLIDDLRGEGPVRFDEFHHGHGGLLPSHRIDHQAIAWAGLQTLVVALLFGFARGIRFGPPRPERASRRRSSLEFVRSMAMLYRRASSRRHVVEAARQRLVREARTRWALAEELPLERLAETLAHQSNLPREEVVGAFRAAEQAIRSPGLTERTMIARVRELARLEQEAFGERHTHP